MVTWLLAFQYEERIFQKELRPKEGKWHAQGHTAHQHRAELEFESKKH